MGRPPVVTIPGFALALCACAAATVREASRSAEARFRDAEELLVMPAGAVGPEPLVPAVPRYPDRARARGESATVVAAFVIDTAGVVEYRTISFLQRASPPFLRAVCDALRASRFAPATVDGRPRRALVVMPFAFTVGSSIPELPTVDIARYRSLLASQPTDSVVARLERTPHCS